VFAPPVTDSIVDTPSRGRPRNQFVPKPIAPYNSDPARALEAIFDRVTGESVDPDQLKTYAEVLAQYHLSPEGKFANGQFLDRGRTERRHVVATGIVLIGKEANQIGESGESGEKHPIAAAVQVFKKLRSDRKLNALGYDIVRKRQPRMAQMDRDSTRRGPI
jgi:hypothetical protein